jgi:hypothetical protein
MRTQGASGRRVTRGRKPLRSAHRLEALCALGASSTFRFTCSQPARFALAWGQVPPLVAHARWAVVGLLASCLVGEVVYLLNWMQMTHSKHFCGDHHAAT